MCNLKAFWRRKIIHFMKNTLFRWNGETNVSYWTLQSVLSQECLVHCFPMRSELPFDRNTAYFSGSSVKNITIVQNCTFQVNGRSTVSLVRKPSMLEEGGSSTLFPSENRAILWKEYLWSQCIWSGGVIHFMKNSFLRRNGEIPVSYGTKQSVLHAGVSCTLFP
jgi:hypothetical protein